MENMMTGGQAPSPAYDFRVYDQVWQRVAPGTDPFSPDPAAAGMAAVPQAVRPIPPVNPAPPVPAPVPRQEGGGEGNLPGAEANPCCMGTEARESLEVLEGFLQEELAESRCCQALACRVRNRQAAQLLCRRGEAGRRPGAVRRLLLNHRQSPRPGRHRGAPPPGEPAPGPAGLLPPGGLQRPQLPEGRRRNPGPLPAEAVRPSVGAVLPPGGGRDGPAGLPGLLRGRVHRRCAPICVKKDASHLF